MLLNFTDAMTNNVVAVNPVYVICVFTAPEDQGGQTIMHMTNGGNIIVTEDYLTVVGQIQGELTHG